MKNIFILAAISFCFLLMPSAIHACSCIASEPATEYNRAEAVFVGKMLGGTEKWDAESFDGKAIQLESGDVKFAVQEIFKGKILKEVTIKIDSMRGTSCGDYGVKRGEIYLVYAYKNDKGDILYTGVCTRTGSVDSEYRKKI